MSSTVSRCGIDRRSGAPRVLSDYQRFMMLCFTCEPRCSAEPFSQQLEFSITLWDFQITGTSQCCGTILVAMQSRSVHKTLRRVPSDWLKGKDMKSEPNFARLWKSTCVLKMMLQLRFCNISLTSSSVSLTPNFHYLWYSHTLLTHHHVMKTLATSVQLRVP